MKLALVFIAAVLLFMAGCATVPGKKGVVAPRFLSEAVKINGVDYIPLTALAEQYRMNWRWDPIAKKAELFKGEDSFVFCAGFDYAFVNGKEIKMSCPALFYEGAAVIPSEFAVNAFVNFFGSPQVSSKPASAQRYVIKKIVIDPGHGGNDPGAIGRNGLKEKEVVLDIAKRLRDELDNRGMEVILTRDRDEFISLKRRAEMANLNDADFFISVHANAARLKGARGFEVYYLSDAVDDCARAVEAAENSFLKFDDASFYFRNTNLEATVWDLVYTENREESIELAKCVAKSVDAATSLKNRGVKSARFCVLRGAQMPSILIEVGFISNSSEENNLKNLLYRQTIASAISAGVISYKNIYESTDGFTK
ncbi:MAG: N-acetylmuramoyl-L-alanine amidase [Candidatus Omnitrophota bacterium]